MAADGGEGGERDVGRLVHVSHDHVSGDEDVCSTRDEGRVRSGSSSGVKTRRSLGPGLERLLPLTPVTDTRDPMW